MSTFALVADDDAPAWVFDQVVHVVDGGWEEGERPTAPARPRWTRQQRRIYRQAQTSLYRHENRGHQGLWVMLSSSAKSDPSKMAAHHAELRRRVQRRLGYDGKLHHFTVRTAEGENVPVEHRGVLHVLWFWEPPVGAAHRFFQVPQRWLSEQWEELHGASYVWVKRYRPGSSSRNRVSRYVIAQYVGDQNALVRYSWSWRITFGVAITRMWREFRRAHGGGMRDIIAGWHRLLDGHEVTAGGIAFALPGAT